MQRAVRASLIKVNVDRPSVVATVTGCQSAGGLTPRLPSLPLATGAPQQTPARVLVSERLRFRGGGGVEVPPHPRGRCWGARLRGA